MKKILFFFLALGILFYIFSDHYEFGSVQAKGTINPAVTQANIFQTICVSGWTKTMRPPVSYTNNLKKQQLKGHEDQDPTHYEEDHFIPLVLGGDPTDPNNLWPQPYPEAHYKDTVEVSLSKLVCTGQMTLKEAQKEVKLWGDYFKGMNLGGVNVYQADQDDE